MRVDSEHDYGAMTPSATGIVMKELVRRAIEEIRAGRDDFEVIAKQSRSGKFDDVVTNLDKKVQELCVKSLRECFPEFGVVCEENGLRIESSHPEDAFFTLDPLDGTKAFTRFQPTGVGTMIALVIADNVVAAFVGDVNSRDIYGFRPDSSKVHRITDYGRTKHLVPDTKQPLSERHLLLRCPIEEYDSWVGETIRSRFKSYEIANGSIGITMARLWNNEVGAVVLRSGPQNPWDLVPIYGISKHLGYEFYVWDASQSGLSRWSPENPLDQEQILPTSVLVIAPKYIEE